MPNAWIKAKSTVEISYESIREDPSIKCSNILCKWDVIKVTIEKIAVGKKICLKLHCTNVNIYALVYSNWLLFSFSDCTFSFE